MNRVYCMCKELIWIVSLDTEQDDNTYMQQTRPLQDLTHFQNPVENGLHRYQTDREPWNQHSTRSSQISSDTGVESL